MIERVKNLVTPGKMVRLAAIGLVALSIGGCQPNVYANVGMSSFGGYHGGMHSSISIGGRICC
jgi:hypothetical protein